MIKTHSANSNILSESEVSKLLEFFPHGLIAVDLETTGLSPLVDKIIEVGALKILPDSTLEVFESLINPDIPIPPHTIEIHHITDDMVLNAPKLNPVMSQFSEFMSDLPIVAHNAKFDLGFIVMAFQKGNIPLLNNHIYCSCKLARHTHMELKNHKLKTLVDELKIPLLNHHRAYDDALASLKIFLKSLEVIKTPLSPMLKRYGNIFSLNDFDKLNSEEIPKILEEQMLKLEKLVKESAVIEIKYSGGNHKNEYRPVKLTSLLNSPDGNILYARCLWSDMQKSFKLKKITDIRMPEASEIQKWLSQSGSKKGNSL